MERKSFFKTKEGGLTIAFILIMAAFLLIMAGLHMGSNALCMAGFVIMVAAMLYSPIKVYILKSGKRNK